MNSRLQQFLELEKLSPARFSDILGVQRSGISHILSGRNKPGYDLIQKILLKFPSLNPDWLLLGKGKVYKEQLSHQNDKKGDFNFSNDNDYPPTNSDQSAEIDLFTSNIVSSQLNENPINSKESTYSNVKRTVKRVTIFYSDGSFDEFLPNK